MNDISSKKTPTSFSMKSYETEINVIKGSPYDDHKYSIITVVGKNEQEILIGKEKKTYITSLSCVGDSSFFAFMFPVYKRAKNDDSDSDDDTYKPYSFENKQAPEIDKKKYCSFFIKEPCISQQNKVFIYVVKRKNPNDIIIQHHFSHNNAIEEASKDLKMCYTNVLTEVLKLCQTTYRPPHTIALPALSTDTGFPRDKAAPIAVNTVLEFVKNNPGKYETINLFVKKRSEFELYKKLLKTYILSPKLALLYYSSQEHESIFSILPSELLKHISQFTFAVTNEYD